MVVALVTIFIVGYFFIAMEHPFKINKTATALALGTFLWTFFAFCEQAFLGSTSVSLLDQTFVREEGWHAFLGEQLVDNLGETAEIVFFLLGAMTIVTLIEDYQGFRVITDSIKTTNKKKLLWVISILTFFLSALLDNMTTAIVMIALLRKLIADKKERWLYAGMVILAANAGGAWSPIGDVTTIMLWIGGQVTTVNIIVKTIVASLVCMVVPVILVGFTLKGDIQRPEESQSGVEVPVHLRKLILIMGVGALVFVPVFKTLTHLPPYLGMLFGLAVLWITTEIISRHYEKEGHKLPTAVSTLEHIDTPTILFFLGILMAVSCLKVSGILSGLASGLNNAFGVEAPGFFFIDLIIGVLSSVVDNVPLVAAAMGMYDITGANVIFEVNHPFWEFLAYCAGTGGSLLIIGSAAGVAVMGMEKIDFIWYLKKISWLALAGYIAGALVFMLMDVTLFEQIEWLRDLA
ncbi:MAG: sodium:proton antiporter NhaD [Bacteroidales bacterium]|nr:sodium:proton antiporter NhaD [Bacteroidales bacterium]